MGPAARLTPGTKAEALMEISSHPNPPVYTAGRHLSLWTPSCQRSDPPRSAHTWAEGFSFEPSLSPCPRDTPTSFLPPPPPLPGTPNSFTLQHWPQYVSQSSSARYDKEATSFSEGGSRLSAATHWNDLGQGTSSLRILLPHLVKCKSQYLPRSVVEGFAHLFILSRATHPHSLSYSHTHTHTHSQAQVHTHSAFHC